MTITLEAIKAIGETIASLATAAGAIVAAATSIVSAFYTWKTRYELDQLYAKTYRPNPDGTPGPMRRHPRVLVRLFLKKKQQKDTPSSPDEIGPKTD